MSSIDAVVDNMRGKLCPHCYGTIYPGDFHCCPAETSDFTLLRKECDTLRTKLDIAADKITVTLTHLREFDNVSHYHYCIDLAKITLDNALAEIEKGGKND